MKIYTYYENINFNSQEELINLWKFSWKKQGYEPIVLTKSDAEKHKYYETFVSKLKKIHYQITGENLKPYGLSCYLRWLAYASQEDETFYVSDYDVININYPIRKPINKIHFMDGSCPCFASGTPLQFENLCKIFVNLSFNKKELIKKIFNSSEKLFSTHYHDQEFFYHSKNFLPKKLVFSDYRNFWFHPYLPNKDMEKYRVIHFCHNTCKTDKNRIELIKKYLNI